MRTINFYRQRRIDGGERTGVEIDGETVLEWFERGTQAEDSALLWFVDIRCSGGNLPNEAEPARKWLLEKAPAIQAEVRKVAGELRVGIDFSAPYSKKIPIAAEGITVQISCSAIRRLEGLHIAPVLEEISSRWNEFLNRLEELEPLTC